MGGFSGFMNGLLFAACSAMFVYHTWRVATSRESRLLNLGQMAFYAAFLLILLPTEPTDLSTDWTFWAASALLLHSIGLTIAHKRRRKLPHVRSDVA